jgi:UDP-2,3-diacylglucosamine pyrophosphatase LpxH
MRVAIISDLHLGRGDRSDRFGHEPARFLRFLQALEEMSDEVVLLGDILDTHHGRVPLAFWREARLCCQAWAALADRLLSGRYRIVAGNHDECIRDLPGVVEEVWLERDGWKTLLLHGHQFDRLITAAPHLCALGNYLGGVAERAGLDGALYLLDKVDDLANGLFVDRMVVYRRKAFAEAARRGADAIILGHLHRQDRQEEAGRTYLNVGCCLQGRMEYGFLDTKQGLVEARRWGG